MLGGHPGLFSPPELNLLPFYSMGEREMALESLAYRAVPCDQRVGLIEAIMHLKRVDAAGAATWLSTLVHHNAPISEMYRLLREMAAPRRVVDKSTLNCSCIESLQRAPWISARAHYIHLIRHPIAVIESLQRMYFRGSTSIEAFHNAEALWTIPNQNILGFLHAIPDHQHHFVRFEDLVCDPESIMRGICAFLCLPFNEGMLNPYGAGRMIDGSPGDFASLGDPNFRNHTQIDRALADTWRSLDLPYDLDPLTQQLNEHFKYQLQGHRERSRRSLHKSHDMLLVVPPFTYRADSFINAARRLGLSPICAFDPAYGVPSGAADYLPISFEHPACAAQFIVDHAQVRRLDGILSVDDGGAEVAALACQALRLPHNPLQALSVTRNKYAMRVLFHKAGVPSPDFNLHMLCENPHTIAPRLRYPVVLKPLHLTGSRGVIRANDPIEFVAAFMRIAALLAQPGTGPDPKCLLVEQYIPGVEVSVDGILQNGALRPLAIYDKPDPMEGPFFEETIFTTPSRLPATIQKRIITCAERASRAIGLRIGPVHVELRINQDEPYLLEIAARTMGGYCSRALPFEGGRTLEELVLTQAAKRSIDAFVPAGGSYGVMMLPIPGEGIYRAVDGTSQAEATPGITGLMITLPVGEVVTPLPDGDKYVGFLFAKGDDPAFVEKALRDAHGCLSFQLDPVPRFGPRAAYW
jgi:glutathione synthase/RimK-type ligase-like ATP-grasp enzyme